MTHSIEEIAEKISALPESLQEEVLDFIEFMHIKAARLALLSKHESAVLNEQASATDQDPPEDDEVWVSY